MKKSALLTVLCAAVLAACSSNAPKTAATTEQPVEAPKAAVAPVPAAGLSAAELEARKMAEERAALGKQSVYFAFDKFNVEAKYADVLKNQAAFTNAHASDVISIEGNADERGSREYNLALGQKRAEAVRKALVTMGLSDSRLEAVSFGSEKPRADCHEEKCYAENRRVDFNHKDK
jgi:peptidoglycan-associated lipoprotein